MSNKNSKTMLDNDLNVTKEFRFSNQMLWRSPTLLGDMYNAESVFLRNWIIVLVSSHI